MKLFRHVFHSKIEILRVGNFNRGLCFSGPEADMTSAPGRRGIVPSVLMAPARSAGRDSAKHLFLQQNECRGHAIGPIPKKIFSRGSDQRRPRAGLVQQTVQIATARDLTLIYKGFPGEVNSGFSSSLFPNRVAIHYIAVHSFFIFARRALAGLLGFDVSCFAR